MIRRSIIWIKLPKAWTKSKSRKKDQIMLSFKSLYYQMQSALNERMGLPYSGQVFRRYCDSITEDLKDKHNTALRQQETRAQLQQRNYELIINRQQMELRIAVIVSLLLGVILALIVLYQQNLKKKERTIHRLSSELQKYSKQLKDNEVLMAQNNESIQELQMQLSTQKASEQEAQLSLIKQLEEQNRQLNLANQNLQHQLKRTGNQLKSAPLKTPHLQELTTEMLRLKEREEALTGQLISTHPLVAELRSKPRFLQPEDFVRIATLVNGNLSTFYRTAYGYFPQPDRTGPAALHPHQIRLQCVANSCIHGGIPRAPYRSKKSRMKKRILQQKSG